MDVESAYGRFMDMHARQRTGQRRDRLLREQGDAEKAFCQNVWWPLRGGFDGLHPEYEVTDRLGASNFYDFAWIVPPTYLLIELKSFGSHVSNMDRRGFCRQLNRETFLKAMGFDVICFSEDDVLQHPELSLTLLRMVLGRHEGRSDAGLESQSPSDTNRTLSYRHREVIRLACTLERPLRPIDVRSHLRIDHRTAVNLLRSLCQKNLFEPRTGPQNRRLVRYVLQPAAVKFL